MNRSYVSAMLKFPNIFATVTHNEYLLNRQILKDFLIPLNIGNHPPLASQLRESDGERERKRKREKGIG